MTPDEIKEARDALGLTQAELAARMGVTVDAVRAWEADRRPLQGAALVLLKTLVQNANREA